jgi:methoxymalonate biosynthesis acyl carrier protein
LDEQAKIRAFLSQRIRGYELKDDEDIFAIGFVNSMFALQLVMFVEKEFNISVEDEDLEIANFNSINAITALVARKSAPVQS